MRYAIITSDLQYAALYKDAERERAVRAFLPGQIAFLQKARLLQVPIFHLVLVGRDDDPREVGKRPEQSFKREAFGSKIIKEVVDEKDIVIEKPKDSGFYQTNLEAKLRELGVDTVVLTGMQAQVCIQTTAADASFRDFRVLVPRDGITSTYREDVERALQWLAIYFASVSSYADLIEMFQQENIA